MTWRIKIRMYAPDWKEWHLATACICYSAEMVAIVQRALEAGGQTVVVEKMA